MTTANEILLLNPRRKKRRAARRRTATRRRTKTRNVNSTRKKRARVVRRAAAAATKGFAMKRRKKSRRRSVRRNPTVSRGRRAISRVRSATLGLNFRAAMKNVPLGVVGMFLAKWAAKRGSPNALESDPSTWNGMTYLKGGVGTIAGAWVANMIRPGSGQRVLEGGLQLLAYKAAQNHLIPKSTFMQGQFGQAEESRYLPGDVETNSEGEPFILGQDGQTWIPLDTGEMGQDALEVPGRLGDVLEPAGRLGAATSAAYARHLFNR